MKLQTKTCECLYDSGSERLRVRLIFISSQSRPMDSITVKFPNHLMLINTFILYVGTKDIQGCTI